MVGGGGGGVGVGWGWGGGGEGWGWGRGRGGGGVGWVVGGGVGEGWGRGGGGVGEGWGGGGGGVGWGRGGGGVGEGIVDWLRTCDLCDRKLEGMFASLRMCEFVTQSQLEPNLVICFFWGVIFVDRRFLTPPCRVWHYRPIPLSSSLKLFVGDAEPLHGHLFGLRFLHPHKDALPGFDCSSCSDQALCPTSSPLRRGRPNHD